MTARFSSESRCPNRCAAAAACSASASLCALLDTAVLLVVSIFALCLLVLRIMLPIG